MGGSGDAQVVYVLHGASSAYANAIFSSLEIAEAWIAKHKLTGLLTAYEVDRPGYEKRLLRDQERRTQGKRPLAAVDPERYTDGSRHWHFYLGLGDSHPDYQKASDQWHAENAKESESNR